MPSYRVERATNANLVYAIAPFIDKVPGCTYNPRTFLLWVYQQLCAGGAALWLGYADDKPCGYLLALAPSPTNVYVFVLHAYTEPHTPLSVTLEAYKQMEAWAKETGAKGLTAVTKRDELGAFERRYGFKPMSTYIVRDFDGGENNGR